MAKMKRHRGRGRKPGNQSNRSYESNGPDVKVRGTAAHVHEKYLQLARDALSSGDRVMAENYFQHAEHYFRIVQANQPPQQQRRERDETDGESADASPEANGASPAPAPASASARNDSPEETASSGEGDPMPVVDTGDGEEAAKEKSASRRGRRPRRSGGTPGDEAAETALESAEPKDGSGDEESAAA